MIAVSVPFRGSRRTPCDGAFLGWPGYATRACRCPGARSAQEANPQYPAACGGVLYSIMAVLVRGPDRAGPSRRDIVPHRFASLVPSPNGASQPQPGATPQESVTPTSSPEKGGLKTIIRTAKRLPTSPKFCFNQSDLCPTFSSLRAQTMRGKMLGKLIK
jgi:hypothetical protein